MIPIESQALAEVLFWYGVLMLIFAIGVGVICHIYDCMEETPEERAQKERQRIVTQSARAMQRIAKQATKEYKKRKRMRSGFWNIFN